MISSKAQPKEFKAGAAFRIVNPQRPVTPAWNSGTVKYSEVYCDFRVQAMAIEDVQGNRVVWMGWDFCDAHSLIVDRIKDEVEKKYGIRPEAFCINASHNHSSPPLLQREAAGPGGFDSEYTEFVIAQAVAVVGEALEKLEPAKLRYSEYMCSSIGINRRKKKDGKMLMLPNIDGPVDHRVQVLAAESVEDSKLICVAVKYACHPVTISSKGLGSDYPGFMREFVEQRHPGAVAVFLQGCGGDVRVQLVNEDLSDWTAQGCVERSKKFGRDLAMSVEWALGKKGNAVSGPIEFGYKTIELPLEKQAESEYREAVTDKDPYRSAWGRKFSATLDKGQAIPATWPYRIQVFRFGEGDAGFTLAALQGEVFTEYALRLEKLLAPVNTIVLGYSNDTTTYVPTAIELKKGGYEPGAYYYWLVPGLYTDAVESMITETAVSLAKQKSK